MNSVLTRHRVFGVSQAMQEWVSFKESIATWTGIDHDALQVLASFILCTVAAIVSRRPISDAVPWLVVLIVAVTNELVSGFVDGAFQVHELLQSVRDLLLVMAVPTAFLVLGRFAPRVMALDPQDGRIMVSTVADRPARSVVDAEFEEII